MVDEILFLVKKIISVFVYPIGWVLLLLVIGMMMLVFRRSRWAVMASFGAALLILCAFSIEVTSHALLRPLEIQAGHFADPAELERRGVKFVVVMGGSLVEGGFPPAEAWGTSIPRVMEGIRLARGITGSKLVLSGASSLGRLSDADAMSLLPQEMGLPKQSLIIMTTARDSDDEAKHFSELLGKHPFALVTSAYHMPRSVKMFRKYGASPIASPCDFRTLRETPPFGRFLPSAVSLLNSQTAIHEYFGMMWSDLREIFSHRDVL